MGRSANSEHVFKTGNLVGVSVSSTTTYNSTPTHPGTETTWQFKATQTAALVGTLIVQVSNSTDQEIAASTDAWLTYDLISPIAIAGTTGPLLIKLTRLAAKRARLSYTNTSGTGTITALVVTQ